jgi:glycosyltransferase involved in cell wall biosynthesis
VTLRVVHVSAYFAPAFVYGGPPRSILGLCRAQRDAGVDVQVITTTANGDSELPETVVARGEYEGIPVRYCERAWPRSVFRAPSLRDAVADAMRAADVLHIHGLWNATVWSAAAAARQERRPYVLSPRGMLAPAALAHDAWRKRLAYPVADRRVIRDAARLHATSRPEFDELSARWGPGRTIYVPNGVELPTMGHRGGAGDEQQTRARFNLPPTAPLVLFLGRIHPIKRLDLVAGAFARVRSSRPGAHLVIAGPDEEGHRSRIAPLFTPLGSSVTWTGRVDEMGKRDLLAAASVLVLCSNSESFGMSAAEAMAAAVPVVVTRTCPWPEIASHDAGFWVDQTPDAIADAVIALLADEPAAQAMGRRGRALIAGHYTWSHAAAALIHEYEAIATGPSSVG